MSWILVLVLTFSSGISVESIKQPYVSEQSCKDAGEVWHNKLESAFKDAQYACIPNK